MPDSETSVLLSDAIELGSIPVPPATWKTVADDTYAPVDSVPAAYQAYVAASAATGPAMRVTPLNPIDVYGESTSAADWLQTTLATLLGVSVINRGVAGQGAADILIRSGLLRPQVPSRATRSPPPVPSPSPRSTRPRAGESAAPARSPSPAPSPASKAH